MLTSNELGTRIAQLRKQRGLSQQQVATALDIPRTALTQVEQGKRQLSALELIKLSEVLEFSLDQFVAKEYTITALPAATKDSPEPSMRISVPELQLTKFREVLLYILEHCAGKPNVGETVLNKLLYFCDFNYYERFEEQLTGAAYRKLPFGPVPDDLPSIIEQMIADGSIQRIHTHYHGYDQRRLLPLEKADLTQLNAAEKDVIDGVIEQFADWNASSISNYSHEDIPWKASEMGQFIDYELVFYRTAPYSMRTYTEDA